ncbi:DUF808 domain-containing protein [Leucobacter weissii]|uniref:DUF808 domain-containing protein n=1 Tax=Leucobacter weissii TaxID=1983706 RepID=A0A939MSL8_9MICO|nr:DUF808 domain-containing protein [Leucobacter weissii]MBO1902254.1 DUF808 domain-containing protein [Leucobacter weissii]
MSASFFALLDDIAVLAKAAAASIDDVVAGAAKASAKSAGVVIDDAAVTPQYVRGISPQRELPVVWKITRGSLANKALIIAAIMLLSVWAPWVFPWLLLIGGTYLAYEGTEKVWHWIGARRGHAAEEDLEHAVQQVVERTETDEKQIVASAVRTDLVLSVEIMLISLSNIDTDSWILRLATLIVVALLMTLAVYGSVALLVKMDDVGLWMLRRPGARLRRRLGAWLVRAMPWVFRALSVIGVVAMLWVGGHILLANLSAVGVPWPYELAHTVTHAIGGPALVSWLIDSALSAVFGLAWGAVVVAVLGAVARLRFTRPTAPAAGESSARPGEPTR